MSDKFYFIAGPSVWREVLAKALLVLVFAAISAGVFFGAMMWAQSVAR